MTSVPDGGWDLPPGASADIIGVYLDGLQSGKSLRIGSGETVPPAYSQVVERALFVVALHRLVPQTTQDLACDEAYAIVAEEYRALGEFFMRHDRRSLDEADRRKDRYIDDWQRRHRLPDTWLHVAAEMTMRRAYDLHRHGRTYDAPWRRQQISGASTQDDLHSHGETYDSPLILPGVTALADVYNAPAHRPSDIPAFLDSLTKTFNPRTQTVDNAVRRLLSELEPQLREHFMSITDDDRTLNGAMEPRTYRKTIAYEWLVRYQVLGESRAGIAETDGKDRPHVSTQVNETAARVGLTLREHKVGRPSKHVG